MESRMDFPDGSSNGARTREVMEVEDTGERRKPTFGTQANALLRKNITFQKRNWGTNCCIVGWPIFTCIALLIAQIAINGAFSGSDYKCGCQNGVCGIEYSDSDQADYCAVPHPPAWPGVIQVPRPQYRSSVLSMGFTSSDNPASMLFTGANPTASLLASYLLLNNAPTNTTDSLVEYSNLVSGSGSWPGVGSTAIIEPAFQDNEPLYVLQNQSCGANSAEPDFNFQYQESLPVVRYPATCLPTQVINRVSGEAIDNELYKGFRKGDPSGNPSKKINEYVSAYDFGNTDQKNFDVNVYYNETLTNDTSQAPPGYARASKSMNLAAQAFLRYIQGPQAELPLWFVKEMPRVSSKLTLDLSSVIGPLFYMWCDQILFIIILVSLVYEKQRNLRIMMKMHGLGDGAYWIISYLYFLALSMVYIFFFVLVGSLIKLNFFRINSYVIQFIFYFIYLNLQIALGFLAASLFTSVKTATVCGYLYVFAFGLLGSFLYQNFLEDKNTGRGWIFAMELIPGFSLYRGLYEFGAYAFSGVYQNTHGMTWKDLKDKDNGMTTVWLIQIVEWALFLALAWYLDRAVSTGGGVRKRPLFFLGNLFKKRSSSSLTPQKSPSKSAGDEINIEMEKPDVAQEAAVVESLLRDSSAQDNNSYAIICNQLKKVYPGTDGNPDKYAVRGLSLAVGRSECFGMLGPNGAGKTSTINMMIGLQKPTSGTAYIKGLDIRTDINQIYTSMGVCPQHDLIWERLTAREHLLFYGRLKNLKGAALEEAVVESLKSVNLYNGLEKKRAGQFSGGMKRRLSVAISLIGDPQVVYMDEPSTGLDPASRFNLWNVVKQAKRGRAIILTTHSMEEAEALCDRLGIFVDGRLQCIGDSKELTARYGGIYVITITTPANEEGEVQKLVESLSPNSQKVYSLAGTQKFEIPKSDVEIGEVFATMENAKNYLSIQAWGLADTTLEDVFVKVARGVQGGDSLS